MYKPPPQGSFLPKGLFWLTALFLVFAVLLSFSGNIRGEFYEHWLTIPLSVAVLIAHFRRSLVVIPLYVVYTVVAWERVMIAVYASQSSVFLLPAPIVLGSMLILWATLQYRPLRTPSPPETPE